MRNLPQKLTASAVAVLVTAGVAVPAAYASTPASGGVLLSAVQAKAASAISVREAALEAAVTDVGANSYLTPADRTEILSVLTADESDLTTLGSTIQADTTATQAGSDYLTIFSTYRVFALRLPQARFAEAADDLTGTVIPRQSDAEARLQSLLSGPDASQDSAAVQAAMTNLSSEIATVTSDTTGLSAQVLAITPSQWDADHTILSTPRAQLIAARSAAQSADVDIATVVGALQ